jgi:tetratricopeptide (TPR) repeat protein
LFEVPLDKSGWWAPFFVASAAIGGVLFLLGGTLFGVLFVLPTLHLAFKRGTNGHNRFGPDPGGNAGWQRALSVSYNKVGDVQRAQGTLPEALKSYRDSLAIADRLAKADPGNAGLQRDLAVSNERLGDIYARQGQTQEAVASFKGALAAYNELLRRNPGDVQSRVFSVVPLWRLGELKGKDGRSDLEAALAILKPLAAANRLDANRRGWIAKIERQIAALEKGDGLPKRA